MNAVVDTNGEAVRRGLIESGEGRRARAWVYIEGEVNQFVHFLYPCIFPYLSRVVEKICFFVVDNNVPSSTSSILRSE